MKITDLIDQLINLKSKGVEEIHGVDDYWSNYKIEVEEGYDGDKEVGYLVVTPEHAFEN